jgi:hypothetical protein
MKQKHYSKPRKVKHYEEKKKKITKKVTDEIDELLAKFKKDLRL